MLLPGGFCPEEHWSSYIGLQSGSLLRGGLRRQEARQRPRNIFAGRGSGKAIWPVGATKASTTPCLDIVISRWFSIEKVPDARRCIDFSARAACTGFAEWLGLLRRTGRVRIYDTDQSQKKSIIYGCSQSSSCSGRLRARVSTFCQLAGLRTSGVLPERIEANPRRTAMAPQLRS